MFKPKGPYCQSCGMPLSKDERGLEGPRPMEGNPASIAVIAMPTGGSLIPT